ncbi:MAG: 3-ketoacyl-ACP reductase [Alphaproteobacteria bacterium]|nr:3-ketoacyl-ACP reductase [Alphaproteobacteria bacterium]
MGVAFVTGAQRGMGRAIALSLAAEGFDVAAVDLQINAALEDTVAEIRAKGVKGVAVACNIADLSAHQPAIDAAQEALGPMTTLVNNAGVSVKVRGDLLEVSPESYDFCQSVNTRGTFFLTQAFARRLRETITPCHRSIITITSANATAVSVARGEYCISKAGASMMSKLFAARLSDEDIGVYEIQPGFIDTEMVAPSKAKYDALIAGGLTVIKRFGTPGEVGRIATTLACGLLPYTSGQAIQADGGLLTVRY